MMQNSTVHQLNENELKAYRFIRNQLVHYSNAPSVREVMRFLGMSSPRSADFIIKKLIDLELLVRRADGKLSLRRDVISEQDNPTTVNVPLVGTVAAGVPILAEENVEAMIPVDSRLVKGASRHFLLRVKGKSMDQKGIQDGDFVLVKQQDSADRGQLIVALIDDEATVKEFIPGDGSVVLRPHSSDKTIKPIVLHDDFQIQGIVTSIIPGSAF